MRSRNLSKLVLLVAVAMAFAFGSLGTATASGLTKGAVKKIAAKVVKKAAPTLSVAHAATASTADSATLLGGSTAAQLKTTGYRYTLPIQAAADNRTYTFPGLPAGTYLVSYSLTMATTASAVSCQFQPDGVTNGVQSYAGQTFGGIVRCGASNIAVVSGSSDFLVVALASSFALEPSDSETVSFIPIDTLVAGSATGTKESRSSGGTAG
jgi:hypothetical protein